jgi:hypothetical protein
MLPGKRCSPPNIASAYDSGGPMMMYPSAAGGIPAISGYHPQFMYPSSIQEGHMHGLNYQPQASYSRSRHVFVSFF